MYEYRAVVASVHDGDTVTLRIDLGLRVGVTATVRLYGPDPAGRDGLNCPELSTPAGKAARDFLKVLLPVGTGVTIDTVKDKTEKFGRWLGVLRLRDGTNVNAALVEAGHATVKRYAAPPGE